MNKTVRHTTLLLTTLLVLAISAMMVIPVLADSGSTPPQVGPASGGRTSNKGSSSNSLSQVPGGTKVVIVDDQGNKVPLGSQTAQDILKSGDPIWCPSTISKPLGSGLNGCTFSFTDLYDLISNISGGTAFPVAGIKPNANGTIWIKNSVVNIGNDLSSAPVIIDPTVDRLGSWANFTLTVKGAWNGFGTNGVTIASPSTFTVPISITNWNNTVTISNITITGATGTGLTVTTPKNITLTGVRSNGNSGGGAVLDNRTGTGSVTVTGTLTDPSQFNNNTGGDGLDVYSARAILINGVTASSNTSGGAVLDNRTGAGTVTVTGTLTNPSQFNSNTGGDGLDVYSARAILINGVTASSNTTGLGVDVDNCLYNPASQCTVTSASTVTLTGLNTFDNGFDGLDAYSFGNIVVSSVTATGNGAAGVWLENDFPNTLAVKSKGSVTLAGVNLLTGNTGGDGLDVLSFGAIKAGNLHATNNSGGAGAYLDNSGASTAQVITLTDSNTFSDNGKDGVDLFSNGAITLSSLSASGNHGFGASIANNNSTFPSNVTLIGSDSFNNNYYDGLDVTSSGIIIENTQTLTANENGITGSLFGTGVNLNNTSANSAKTVILNGVSTFDGNYAQVFDGVTTYGSAGLVIFSNGNISVNKITANDNTNGAGALLDNLTGSPKATVTLAGSGFFNNNAGDGIDVITNGTVTMTKVNANGNQGTVSSTYTGDGVYVSAGVKVTLTCSNLVDNAGYGVDVVTAPHLTLNGVVMVDNASGNLYFVGTPVQTFTCKMP